MMIRAKKARNNRPQAVKKGKDWGWLIIFHNPPAYTSWGLFLFPDTIQVQFAELGIGVSLPGPGFRAHQNLDQRIGCHDLSRTGRTLPLARSLCSPGSGCYYSTKKVFPQQHESRFPHYSGQPRSWVRVSWGSSSWIARRASLSYPLALKCSVWVSQSARNTREYRP